MQGAQCKGIMSSLQHTTAQQFIYGEWCFYAILFVNPAADKHEKIIEIYELNFFSSMILFNSVRALCGCTVLQMETLLFFYYGYS